MYKMLFFITFCLPALPAPGQTALVIDNFGKVTYSQNKRPVLQGQQLQLQTQLTFPPSGAVVVCFIPGRGLYTVKPDPALPSAPKRHGEFVAALTNLLLPTVKHRSYHGRAGTLNSYFDIKNYFRPFNTDTSRLLVINEYLLPVNKKYSVKGQPQYFFLRYTYNGKPVNKALAFTPHPSNADLINLRLDTNVFKIGGRNIRPDKATHCQLFYYNEQKELADSIATFYINIIRLQEVSRALCLLPGSHEKNMTWQNLAKDYLYNFYGLADDAYLDKQLSSHACK